MELSTVMRFVMTRAKWESAALAQRDVFPDHLLLGILKLAELSAEDITPLTRHKDEINRDIDILKKQFDKLETDTGVARKNLRRILYSGPNAGNGTTLTLQLLERAAGYSKHDSLRPNDVLLAMMDDPTPAMKAVLNLGGDKADKPNAEKLANSPVIPEETGRSFLSTLTERISGMRYALLKKVHGQDHVVHAFTEGMFAAEVLAAADEHRVKPRAIFVFAGPPGVGKTFLAEQAAEALRIPCKRFDMSGFSDHQAHVQLIGFAPSYKDAKPGQLTGFVKEHPRSILLFDEIEKAGLSTIHLFLQILDAGRLHDDYTDQDVTFKDTIIIFTSNAGRQLYEGGHRYSPTGLSRQTILNALETDTHPQTGKPFFPAAICSRLATGVPVMFSHLAANSLESVSAGELTRLCTLFKKQFGIHADFDPLLPAILLFAEGGQVDARILQARSELFFKNEIFTLCRLWEGSIAAALEKLNAIHFAVDRHNLPESVVNLFNNPDETEILVFGDAIFAAKIEDAAPHITVHIALGPEEAFTQLSKHNIRFVLLKLVNKTDPDCDPLATRLSLNDPMLGLGTAAAFNNIPIASSSLHESRSFFKALRERMPELPVYLLEDSDFLIDRELENAFVRAGARGKLNVSTANVDVFIEDLTSIAGNLYLQEMAVALAAERKVLSFETAPILSADKTEAFIRLREFALRRAADANDTSIVLDEVEKPKLRFSDVIGAQDAKDELAFFINYLKHPKSFSAKGLKPPKGILLHGPPGTGKTLLAKAMAGESDVAFIPSVASGFVTKWQGSGPEAVRELFQRARRYAPSIIFIDEIDAIGRTRGRGGGAGHGEEMALNALLTEMDGFSLDPKRPVFVLAATNFAVEEEKGGMGVIDPALVRRFDRRILVDLPNKADRRQYLHYMLSKHDAHIVDEEMIERLSGRSTGLSLANLETVIELAARNAARSDKLLDDEILEEAFEIFRHGEQKNWGHEYLERVARHEAGHAYLCYLNGKTPSYLTIIARGSHGGYMEHADTETSPLQTKAFLLNRICTLLGGRAAEIVYYGNEEGLSTGASGDLDTATQIAKAIIISYGMDEESGLVVLSRREIEKGPLTGDLYRKINTILDEQMKKAISLVREGKDKLDKLTTALLEKNRLTGEEMDAVLKG